jgi:hypothetical protein
MIFLLIHLNYDSAMANEQVSYAREKLFVSATTDHQSQWSMKHSKVSTFLFQMLRLYGSAGGPSVRHWW